MLDTKEPDLVLTIVPAVEAETELLETALLVFEVPILDVGNPPDAVLDPAKDEVRFAGIIDDVLIGIVVLFMEAIEEVENVEPVRLFACIFCK